MLIIFSGLDGAGKTTQVNLLLDYLRSCGHCPAYIWTRGGYTSFFNRVKKLMRCLLGKSMPSPGRSPERKKAMGYNRVQRWWLILALLDLFRVYALQIRFLIWLGRTVVCDRYLMDTVIDFRLNFREQKVEKWILFRLLSWSIPRPQLQFLMHIPVEEAIRRSILKGEPFPDSAETLARRLEMYGEVLKYTRWKVLDGQKTMEETASEIREAVDKVLIRGGVHRPR